LLFRELFKEESKEQPMNQVGSRGERNEEEEESEKSAAEGRRTSQRKKNENVRQEDTRTSFKALSAASLSSRPCGIMGIFASKVLRAS